MAADLPATNSNILKRLGDSVPAPLLILLGSAIWGMLVGLAALIDLYLRDGLATHRWVAIISLYVCGAAASFAPGLMLANFACGRSGAKVRFVVGGIIGFLSTHTATATLFALQYRVFYAQWHADFPSIVWCFQLVFTSAAAVYQFTVDSLYVYYPWAIVLFAAYAVWFARLRATADRSR
ncbi:hypothetical protein JJB09_05220 [Rhizobium sp. KVB221]|uniref:Uncharacterized protein n=1 Tax=Rhizobium setariae TaxID=2801340 RepID=A0A937CP53_9HYPH|nr:hypothetical protein [Rhizobium setariae]MBL0371422.1 hypothetical protein [Rhizobium setariae]